MPPGGGVRIRTKPLPMIEALAGVKQPLVLGLVREPEQLAVLPLIRSQAELPSLIVQEQEFS